MRGFLAGVTVGWLAGSIGVSYLRGPEHGPHEDTYTTTVDGAAAHARWHFVESPDPEIGPTELAEMEADRERERRRERRFSESE